MKSTYNFNTEILIEISMEFDKISLISATDDDIKHFACYKDYIFVNRYIKEMYNRG